MKIAVCLYGEFREFEYTLSSLSIWEKFNPEYYVSTWNVSKQTSDSLKIEIIETVDEDKIKKHIPNSSISILDKINPENNDNEVRLHHHWRNLIKMLKESKKKYDLVIFRRIDLFIHDFKEDVFLNTNFKKNTIYIPAGLAYKKLNEVNFPFVDDNLFISNSETIIKFIDELPNESMRTHFGIAESLIKSNIDIKEINFCEYFILRPTMRKYLTDDYKKNCKFLIDNYQSYYRLWCDNRNID
jgi:hypothetical protein